MKQSSDFYNRLWVPSILHKPYLLVHSMQCLPIMESSTYKKLHSQEIRILVLLQGTSRDALFGRVITRNLKHYIQTLENGTTDEDLESFEALSHT
jgi:hypothetical protein